MNSGSAPPRRARGCSNLQTEGFLSVEPRRGFMVTALSSDDIRDIYDAQALLGGELAGPYRRDHHAGPTVGELERIQDALERAAAADDFDEEERLNHEFHALIYRLSGSRKMRWLIKTTLAYAPRKFFAAVDGWPEASAQDHRAIIEHLRGQRPREGPCRDGPAHPQCRRFARRALGAQRRLHLIARQPDRAVWQTRRLNPSVARFQASACPERKVEPHKTAEEKSLANCPKGTVAPTFRHLRGTQAAEVVAAVAAGALSAGLALAAPARRHRMLDSDKITARTDTRRPAVRRVLRHRDPGEQGATSGQHHRQGGASADTADKWATPRCRKKWNDSPELKKVVAGRGVPPNAASHQW